MPRNPSRGTSPFQNPYPNHPQYQYQALEESNARFLERQRQAAQLSADRRPMASQTASENVATEVRVRQELERMRAEYETQRNVLMALEVPSAWASASTGSSGAVGSGAGTQSVEGERGRYLTPPIRYMSFESLRVPHSVEVSPQAWADLERQRVRASNPNARRQIDQDELPE